MLLKREFCHSADVDLLWQGQKSKVKQSKPFNDVGFLFITRYLLPVQV